MDPGLPASLLDQLGEHQLRTAGRRRLGNAFAQHSFLRLRQHRQEVGVIEPGIPDVEHVHRGKVAHFAAIAASAGDRRVAAVRVAEPVGTGSEHKGGDEPFDVPPPGAGKVSSRSLMSKITRRSGVAKTPKFIRWASPHTWTWMPVVGVSARSAAMTPADPR